VMKRTSCYPRPVVDGKGRSVVAHAGGTLLLRTAAAVGLDAALSAEMSRWRRPTARHDPGKIVLDLADRYLRVTATGLLRIDAAAVRRETHLDGKWLLRSSDPSLSAEDIAAGYKQLLEVERGWPVNHRKEDPIRAHVLLCWLALLLIRIAENEIPTHTWRRLREELQTLHVGQFTGNAGHVHQRTELTPAQRDILRALQVIEPPRFLQLTAAD